MCLILHSRGHLTVKLLLEQLVPTLLGGEVQFLHCYDYIFRSHARQDIDRLYILSRQGTSQHGTFKLMDDAKLKAYEWPFQESTAPGASDYRTVRLDGQGEIKVRRVVPKLSLPSWMATNIDAVAAFRSTGMTLARVEFCDNCRIQRFDPKRSAETTYWMRLAFIPDAGPPPRISFNFGPETAPLFLTRSCEVLSPALVLDQLSDRLTLFETETHLAKGARAVRRHVLEKCFLAPESSTRIEDHRISLVTSPSFLVLNTISQGKCGFLGMQAVQTKPISVARTWFTGARHYPTSDPLGMAGLVYKYLREWAYNEKDAKQKEAISSAVAPDSHSNVSHVVDALVRLGFVVEAGAKKGRYWICHPPVEDGKLFLTQFAVGGEIEMGERDAEIRNCLYGDLSATDQAISSTRFLFSPGGARIHYDLACQLRSV